MANARVMASKYMLHQIFLPKKPSETGSLKISVMSRHDKPWSRGSAKAETAQRNSVGNQSHPERLATPGSEFCVVVSNGGTKRKQPVPKPGD